MLPSGTILGALEIVEVYETYDVPRLFLAASGGAPCFIALWVDVDEQTETWLYLYASPARLRTIRRGEIDLRTAFRESEAGHVWEAVFNFADGEWNVTLRSSALIPDERLPDPGQRLNDAGVTT